MDIKATIKQIKGDYRSGGLDLERPEDPRDYSLLEFSGRRKLGKAPDKEFFTPNVPPVKNQFYTDFCVSFESSYTAEQDYQPKLENWKRRLSAAFNFAATKKRYYGGNYSGFGLSIPCGLGSLQHDGICLEYLWPMLKSSRKRNFMANWRNIPAEAWADAKNRKMDRGYFKVDTFRDRFENFAAGLYYWQEMVITGLYWFNGFYVGSDDHLILNKTGSYNGHCIGAIGYDRHPKNKRRRMWFTNSYPNEGRFWLYEEEVRAVMYNGYVVLPKKFTLDAIKIIKKYAGKLVKSEDKQDPRVFLIIDGEKRWLKNEEAFWSHGYTFDPDKITRIPQEEIAIIPTGKDLEPRHGEYYPILKEFATKHKIKL